MSRASSQPGGGSRKPTQMDHTEFFGSQVGGESVISYSYTDLPLKLLMWDVRYFFVFAWALPWILWPIRPCDGDHFDELAPTRLNLWCILVHTFLIVIQIGFIISLPWVFLFPAWMVIIGLAVFLGLNKLLCKTLNGNTITFTSDPEFAPALEEHAHEQWIFINGVAVGEAWLKSNINRLALTFKRPVIGIHNQTSGIIFDIIECLIQRNFGFATRDVRVAYKIVKGKLYNPKYSKVIFILHSQGGIEGGLVLDWLLQELPQDLLSKLEVYTFGNAANHFNNPHRHIESQKAEKANPKMDTKIAKAIVEVPLVDSPIEMRTPASSRETTQLDHLTNNVNHHVGEHESTTRRTPAAASEQNSIRQRKTTTVPATERAIGHVEHYAHTTDFVALLGVLHFATNKRASPQLPRYIGRVFSRTSARGGHQFSQHYLNGMFALARDPETGRLAGCAETNEFMESVVEAGEPGPGSGSGSAEEVLREGVENSWAQLRQDYSALEDDDDGGGDAVSVHGSFHEGHRRRIRDGKVRVKDLSRLWLYRNGGCPPDTPWGLQREANGIARGFAL